MKFSAIYEELKAGKTMEQIAKDANLELTCKDNDVQENDKFYAFLNKIGVSCLNFAEQHVNIQASNGFIYQFPYITTDDKNIIRFDILSPVS